MKKIKRLFMIFTLTAAISLPAYSWDLGLGITSYYSAWEPAFLDTYSNVKTDPVFLAGPVISLRFFDRFMLGGQLINNPSFNSTYKVPVQTAGNVELEIKKLSRRIGP